MTIADLDIEFGVYKGMKAHRREEMHLNHHCC